MAKLTPARPTAAKAGSPPAPPAIDAGLVRELATLLADTDLSEIEVENGDLRIRVARQARAVAAAPPAQVVVTAPAAVAAHSSAGDAIARPVDHPGALKSPMVGTAYRRPSPDAPAFVEIGSTVKPGDKIFLVEAMKTFNEIVAARGGVVTAIMVEDGQPVEYGQTLAIIE